MQRCGLKGLIAVVVVALAAGCSETGESSSSEPAPEGSAATVTTATTTAAPTTSEATPVATAETTVPVATDDIELDEGPIDPPLLLVPSDAPTFLEGFDVSSPEAALRTFLHAYSTGDFVTVWLTLHPDAHVREDALKASDRSSFLIDGMVERSDVAPLRAPFFWDALLRVGRSIGAHRVPLEQVTIVGEAGRSEGIVDFALDVDGFDTLIVRTELASDRWLVQHIRDSEDGRFIFNTVDVGTAVPASDAVPLKPMPLITGVDVEDPIAVVGAFHDAYSRGDFTMASLLVDGLGRYLLYSVELSLLGLTEDERASILADEPNLTPWLDGTLWDSVERARRNLGLLPIDISGPLSVEAIRRGVDVFELPTALVEATTANGDRVVFRLIRGAEGWGLVQIASGDGLARVDEPDVFASFHLASRRCVGIVPGDDRIYEVRAGRPCLSDPGGVPDSFAEEFAIAQVCFAMQSSSPAMLEQELESYLADAVERCSGDPGLVTFVSG